MGSYGLTMKRNVSLILMAIILEMGWINMEAITKVLSMYQLRKCKSYSKWSLLKTNKSIIKMNLICFMS